MRSPWGRNPSSNWKWIHSDWGSLWNPFQGGKLLYGVGRDQRSKLRNGLQKGLVRARLLVLHQLELALLGIPPHIVQASISVSHFISMIACFSF